jgi:hypothetical protein
MRTLPMGLVRPIWVSADHVLWLVGLLPESVEVYNDSFPFSAPTHSSFKIIRIAFTIASLQYEHTECAH